ncbi:MAG: AMP-binding protein [Lachnospiraceae bacterium]|nr:AMP-binding protein [Lachnospiraceae bacterium]
MKRYPHNEVTYYSRFRDMIDGMAEEYGESPAISWFTRKQEEKGVSYNKLRDDVRGLQEMLIRMGLAGKHIAIVGENSYEWLLVYFAANYCGSVAVCIDIEQSDETILQMLEMADVSAIFLASPYAEICGKYEKQDVKMFLLSGRGPLPTVQSLAEQGQMIWKEGSENREIDEQVCPDNTAAIVFTSGTTSYAKPVMLSQNAILTNASDALANVRIGDRTFTSLPFYHTYGLTCSVLSMLIPGSHLYINGNLRTVMKELQLAKPHTLLTVPLMLETIHSKIWLSAEENGKTEALKKLLKLKKIQFALGLKKSGKTLEAIREKTVGSIRLIICGGAHMSREIMEEFMYMGVTVLQGYGITECGPLVSVNRNEANKLDSVGLVTAHCEVKIEDGEILVRGANLMQGYYKHQELTDEVMRDGWFCTGDMGEIDKDGFLYITGRKKNLIVFKNGKKVSPEKLEEKLKKISLVQDVMVYGAASGISTDDVQIAASIYPSPEKTEGMTSYEILEQLQREINRINDELPIYQQIQMVNIREQEFSKTALQKIKRHMA